MPLSVPAFRRESYLDIYALFPPPPLSLSLPVRAQNHQANPGFLRAAVVRSDADALLLPLLRTLHDCASPSSKAAQSPAEERKRNTQRKEREKQQQQRQRLESQAPTYAQRGADVVGSSSPSLYVPAIVILLFSQDAAFDRQSFRQVRTSMFRLTACCV